jgi:hypothetical protein
VYSETLALAYAALLHQMRLDTARTLYAASAVIERCDRYGFAYYGDWARVLIGWTRGNEHPAEGVETIEAALARLDARRAQARRPYYMSLLADTYRRLGAAERAGAILDGAITISLERNDMWWLPALYLQKGELEPRPKRDVTINRGLALAIAQKSRSLERRLVGATGSGSA